MTLHPRLQPPTLESPVRRGHSFTLALALAVFAAGFAYAMPRTVLATADAELQQDEVALVPTGSTHTSTATTPKQKKTTAKDETGEEGDTQRAENHGAAVSTAAHCDLDGKAHGEFVRSIAHDKDATVAEVEAACDAAKASAATAGATDGTVKHGASNGKSGKSARPKVKLVADDGGAEVEAETDDADHDGPPEHAGPPARPSDEAKGPKNKP